MIVPGYQVVLLWLNLDCQNPHFAQVEIVQLRLESLQFLVHVVSLAVSEPQYHRQVQNWTTSHARDHRHLRDLHREAELLYDLVLHPLCEEVAGVSQCQQGLVRKVADDLVKDDGGKLL